MAKILIKSLEKQEAEFPKLNVFVGQNSIFRHCCFQNVRDGIPSRLYKINKGRVTDCSQSNSVKLRKLRLKKNDGYGFL